MIMVKTQDQNAEKDVNGRSQADEVSDRNKDSW